MELWIARDRDGALYLYDDIPEKVADIYFVQQGCKNYARLSDNLFPEVTFENSPQEVELKLVKEK